MPARQSASAESAAGVVREIYQRPDTRGEVLTQGRQGRGSSSAYPPARVSRLISITIGFKLIFSSDPCKVEAASFGLSCVHPWTARAAPACPGRIRNGTTGVPMYVQVIAGWHGSVGRLSCRQSVGELLYPRTARVVVSSRSNRRETRVSPPATPLVCPYSFLVS